MKQKLILTSMCTFALLGFTAYTSPSLAADLESYKDNAKIVAVGTISDLSDDKFILSINEQIINVDYNEWGLLDFTDLTNYLKNGQKVVVTGEVDDNLFSEDRIEAESIYFVANNNYYSLDNSYPDYDLYNFDRDMYTDRNNKDRKSMNNKSAHDNVTIRGEVVSLMDEKFTMATESGMIKVNIKPLSPNREESRLHVEIGDNVLVYGKLDENIMKKDTLSADTVVKLNMRKNN